MDGPAILEPRRATTADGSLLVRAGRECFIETFGHLYRPGDLAAFLASAHTAESWQRTLSDPELATWVALAADGEVAGYAVAGPCKLPVAGREPRAGELRQLYLRGGYQRRGLGTRLLENALTWLEAAGHEPLYIGVWSENFGAQRLYARHGFYRVGEYLFPVGEHRDLEFILKRQAHN